MKCNTTGVNKLSLSFLFLLSIFCLGQEADESAKSEDDVILEFRRCRMIYFDGGAKAPQKAFLHLKNGELIGETSLPRVTFSPDIALPDGELLIYFLPEKYTGDPADFPTDAPSIPLAEDIEKVLFLVFKDEGNPVMPIKVVPINANDDAYGGGNLLIINFTGHTISGTLNDKPVKVGPQSKTIVRDIMDAPGYYRCLLNVHGGGISTPRAVMRTMLGHSELIRRMLVIKEGKLKGRPSSRLLEIRTL